MEKAATPEVESEVESEEEWARGERMMRREKPVMLRTPPFLLIFIFSFLLFFCWFCRRD